MVERHNIPSYEGTDSALDRFFASTGVDHRDLHFPVEFYQEIMREAARETFEEEQKNLGRDGNALSSALDFRFTF